MASVAGALFDEYAALTAAEKQFSHRLLNPDVLFDRFAFGSGPLKGSTANDVFFLDAPNDVLPLAASGGIDLVISEISVTLTGADHLVLTGGEDLSGTGNGRDNTLIGNDGDNRLNGGAGNDVILGGMGDDCIQGGSGDDSVHGGAGDDGIIADSGNDWVFAGAGNDTVSAGSGNDTLVAGDGDDRLSGGSGRDTFSFEGGEGEVVITDFNVAQDALHIMSDINATGIGAVQDILANHVSENAEGDAVITLGGLSVTLENVQEEQLTAVVFVIY